MEIFQERGVDTFILVTSDRPNLDRGMDMIMSVFSPTSLKSL